MSASAWLTCRLRIAEPSVRMYCFAHSGGATGEYMRWADELPGVEVWGVNLPGRGARLDEPPLTEMVAAARTIAAEVAFEPPFVLFGHSLGGLIAFEVARELRAQARRSPFALIVSAAAAPHRPHTRPHMRHLPDNEFLTAIGDTYGGLPQDLLDNPELLDLILPAFRADLTMLETYRYEPGPPLDIPVTVLGGQTDPLGAPQLAGWQRHTGVGCRILMLPGGHFYFREHPGAALAALRDCLRAIAAGAVA